MSIMIMSPVIVMLLFVITGRFIKKDAPPLSKSRVIISALITSCFIGFWIAHKYMMYYKFGVFFGLPLYWIITVLITVWIYHILIYRYIEAINKHVFKYESK